jgi:hypothetical protein
MVKDDIALQRASSVTALFDCSTLVLLRGRASELLHAMFNDNNNSLSFTCTAAKRLDKKLNTFYRSQLKRGMVIVY